MASIRRKDIIGQKFGNLTVTEFSHVQSEQAYWKCQCECGGINIVRGSSLRSGEVSNCSLACYHRQNMEKFLGKTFNHLTIINVNKEDTEKFNQYYVNAECDCGKIASLSLTKITNGKSKACSAKCSGIDKYAFHIGSKFGRLLVKDIVYKKEYIGSDVGRFYFRCKCDCGNEKDIIVKNVTLDGVRSCGCLAKEYAEDRDGDQNPNWRGGITPENLLARASQPYWNWQGAVFARDNHTCQKCGYFHKFGDGLNAHHILNFSANKELRFVIENGLTLCRPCHTIFHSIYGRDNNDSDQIKEFIGSFQYQTK